MKTFRLIIVFVFLLLSILPYHPAQAADAVVSVVCNEAAFVTALNSVQASAGGIITFNCSNAPFYILFRSQKVISKNVVIDGGNLAILSGDNVTRLFYVSTGASLTLKNITVRNGNSNGQDGGAIYSLGSLVIDNSHFLNNTTNSMNVSGGAIINYGPLTITNSELAYNSGGGAGAVYPRWAAAVTNITNSVIHDNNATNNTGSGWGGALLAWDGAPVTITGSTFYANDAYRDGGAILITANSTLSMSDSILYKNIAGYYGGAINIQGTANITNTLITGNLAYSGGGGFYNTGIANLNRVTISDNQVFDPGGGIYNQGTLNLYNSTIIGNQAFRGGGIRAGGMVTILNSTLANNLASYSNAYGGGITVEGTVILNFTTLLNNDVNGLDSEGGASIWLSGGTVSFKNSIIKSNPDACAGSGSLISNGFNIGTDFSCNLSQVTDHEYVEPQLGELEYHRAITLNALPNPGSPALDGGQCAGITSDQRGFSRPIGAACDIGAVERQSPELTSSYLPLAMR